MLNFDFFTRARDWFPHHLIIFFKDFSCYILLNDQI